MRSFLIYLGFIGLVVVSIFTVAALWYVRSALPFVGLLLVGCISIGVVGFTAWLLGYGWLHLRGKYLSQRLLVADDHRLAYHESGQIVVHATIQSRNVVPALPPPPIEDESLNLPTAPPYRTIAHLVKPGRLILGYGVSGAIYGDITDLLSTAIIGRPGTGKSTWLRCVLAQVLRVGGQAVILDPHGSIADEVGDVLHCAETASEIDRSAAWLGQELDRRLAARRSGQAEQTPILLLADEWPIIQAMSEQATQAARRVILEGRKVSMFALICGQGLPASLLGGSLVRDALASRYVFNTTAQQARMAGIDNETAKVLLAQLETSGPGLSILATARRKPEIVAIPETVTGDIVEANGSSQKQLAEPYGTVLPTLPYRDTDETEAVKLPCSESEKQQILLLAKAGVARRDMPKALGWSASKYSIIKAVLDQQEGI